MERGMRDRSVADRWEIRSVLRAQAESSERGIPPRSTRTATCLETSPTDRLALPSMELPREAGRRLRPQAVHWACLRSETTEQRARPVRSVWTGFRRSHKSLLSLPGSISQLNVEG